jgi:hypothetical protein
MQGGGDFMRKAVFIAFMFLFLFGCQTGMEKHKEQARQGLLTLGLNRDAILAEWGLPDRTHVISSDEFMQISAGWGAGSGRFSFFKGKVPLDVWVYEEEPKGDAPWRKVPKAILYFHGLKLVGWTTEKTVKELKPPPK